MSSLTHEKAVAILDKSDDLANLTEAVAFLAEDPDTKPEELLPALDHLGIVAEHAAIALHKMTETPWNKDGQPITSRGFWNVRLESGAVQLFRRIDPETRQAVVDIILDAWMRAIISSSSEMDRTLHALKQRLGQEFADSYTSGKKPHPKHRKITSTT